MMNGIVKIGQLAPDIEAVSTMGDINLNNYKGKWIVLFSHPRRFYSRVVFQFGEIQKKPDIALISLNR